MATVYCKSHVYVNINILTTGNHTIAVVKGKEDYQLLNTSLANAINEVNSVGREGAVEVKGKKVKIQLYLGGDYKVKTSWYHFTIYFRYKIYLYCITFVTKERK